MGPLLLRQALECQKFGSRDEVRTGPAIKEFRVEAETEEIIFFFLSFFINFREKASRGSAERERERIPSRVSTVSTEPDLGLELTNCEITT